MTAGILALLARGYAALRTKTGRFSDQAAMPSRQLTGGSSVIECSPLVEHRTGDPRLPRRHRQLPTTSIWAPLIRHASAVRRGDRYRSDAVRAAEDEERDGDGERQGRGLQH